MKYTATILIKPGLQTKLKLPEEPSRFSALKRLFIVENEDIYEELNNAPDILLKIQLALREAGLTNLVRITHDEKDFYLDTENIPNDLETALSDFQLEMQIAYERFYEQINVVIEDTVDEMNYIIDIRLLRVHFKEAFPIRFKITATPINVNVKKKEERFRLFIRKLEQNLHKYMQIGLIRVRYSAPSGYETASKHQTFIEEKKYTNTDTKPGNPQKKDCRLFPLYGISLGKTKVSKLKQIAQKATMINPETKKPYKYYSMNNMQFWYDKDIVDRIYMTYSHTFPEQWQKCGFDWNLSYNEWRKLIINAGWGISDIEPPKIEFYEGKKSLTAEFKAITKTDDNIRLEIEFYFAYSQKTGLNAKETLYSIRMQA